MTDQSTDIFSCPLIHKCLKGGDTSSSHHLTSAQKKSAEVLRLELELLPVHEGIQRLLFVTLTFSNPLPDRKHRNACYLKFRKYFLEKKFQYGVTILDRSETKRPHFHMIVVGNQDCDFRTGFDFGAWDASCAAEQRWNNSARTDHAAGQQWRALTAKYTGGASHELRAVWNILSEIAESFGFGRINALPIKDPIAYARYLAKCVTNGFRENHSEDRGIRRYRFWGNFNRKVTLPFYRLTRGATRWRGRLAFCGAMLGFTDLDDFKKCFGPQWFIHLKGIIRTVPVPIAEASLQTTNLPLNLLATHQQKIKKIETELLGRREQYGYRPQTTTTRTSNQLIHIQ
jgi:hypothetical protein